MSYAVSCCALTNWRVCGGLIKQSQPTYIPITTKEMRLAAHFWARLRRTGKPTAPNDALDGDVILAAQAAALLALGEDVIVATTNPHHLARLVPAAQWDTIAPSIRE